MRIVILSTINSDRYTMIFLKIIDQNWSVVTFNSRIFYNKTRKNPEVTSTTLRSFCLGSGKRAAWCTQLIKKVCQNTVLHLLYAQRIKCQSPTGQLLWRKR